MREDVIGRANVEDTPELDAYYRDLGRQQSYALWTVANDIEPWQPQPTSLPTLWSYAALRPLVLQALDMVSPEKAGRRVIALENPGRKGLSACVGWLYTGLQVMRPGEFATAHNHASSALRFIMEGAGGYTVVDGHKMSLAAGDFVITPNGTWHDHGVEADGDVTIWQDGLDMLLVNQLDANFYAVHPEHVQKSNFPLNDTVSIYGGRGLLPIGRRGLEQALLAAAQVRMEFDLRHADAGRAGDRRLALRRHHHAIRQSGDRRAGDEDARRVDPAAAGRRAHARASAYRVGGLQRRQGRRAIRSSPAGGSTGRRTTSSSCRRGPGTSTPTHRIATTRCCSRSTTCRPCMRSASIARKLTARATATSRWCIEQDSS